MMIPKRIAIATEQSTLVAPEPPCSCEPIQTQPSGIAEADRPRRR